MQPAAGRQAKAGDISGIRRDFWFDQHDVQHTTPKTKKAPQRPRRFFRREGIFDAGLVGRTKLRHFHWFDIHPATTSVEPYDTVYQSKNRIIATQADVLARQKLRSTLPDNDVSSHYLLTPKFLDPEAFADAVATVLNAALTFFVRHTESPTKGLLDNCFNFDTGQRPAMTDRPVVSLATPVLEGNHFFVLELFDNLA